MTRTRIDPVGAVVRFLASVLIVSGTLLIADATLTLAWQEPISAISAARAQHKLAKLINDPVVRARVIARRPLEGDAIGRIVIPKIHKKAWIVQGTEVADLKKGPGHYPDTPMPGRPGTVGIAGHRTTHGAPFRHIDDLKRGNQIILEMPYGTYFYSVEKTKIVDPSDVGVKHRVGYDRLFLSACHPLYSAAQRIIVFARYVRRGPAVVARGHDKKPLPSNP